MPTSRPSLAFAGGAAVLVVAGVVSHQVLMTPRSPSMELARLASPKPTEDVTAGDPYAVVPPQPEAVRVEVGSPPLAPAEPAEPEVLYAAAPPQPEAVRVVEVESPPLALEEPEILYGGRGVRPPGAVREPLAPAEPEILYGRDSLLPDVAPPHEIAAYQPDLERYGSVPEMISGMTDARSRERTLVPLSLDAEGLRPMAIEPDPGHYRERGRDRFPDFDPNPVKVTAEMPVSTFSIDVDTAAYGYMRASLNEGRLPEKDAVRIEELINYFPYGYTPPPTPDTPFAAQVSLMPAPWNDATRLMHIGIEGYAPDRSTTPRANLVFLIDTSGSMDAPNRLPLLINSFKLLLGALAPEDRVAIVAYAGSAGVVLPPTEVAERTTILASLEHLHAGGSTAGAEGIRQAYRLAEQHRVEDGVNRVILATDGDFNVGITDPDELEHYIARKRAGGVFLSVLGFGMGNYDDALMQRLAQNGNGNAAYIDTLSEARKVLVEEGTSTLFPIAKDVKIQVEFNPAAISEYRLIGYETRMLAREDFRNDKVDAGEIGAGHTVTAIYEVTPAGSGAERVAPLRYRREEAAEASADFNGELAFLKIRYKLPDAGASTLITRPVTRADGFESIHAAPRDVRFAAAVAGFGQLLRGGRYTGDYDYDDVIALAQGARGEDPFGYRAELVDLVRLARSLAVLER